MEDGSGGSYMIIQFLVAFAATYSFAILFKSPKSHYVYCGLSGGIGWISYLFMNKLGLSNVSSCLCATFVLMMAVRLISVIKKTPVLVFLISGIFPLVPGAGIYYTARYFVAGDMNQVAVYGMTTFMTAGAIALGVLFGSAIPQVIFNKVGSVFAGKRAN